MKLKRFAMKGLIVLAVVVALCMFFARTVQTITTPKVQIVTGSTGRFEQEMKFQATVEFPEKEEIILEDATKSNIVIEKVYVQPGHWVAAGETIFTAHLPGYEEDMKKLQEDYQTKSQELLDLDIANRKLSKESKQNELYDELLDSQDKLAELTYQTRFAAMQAGINLTGDPSEWSKQLAALKDVPAEIAQAVDKTVAAKGAVEAARTAFFEVYENRKLRVSEDVFKYIKDRNTALEALNDLQEQMVALDSRNATLSKVTAPRDGYIVSVDVAEGDTYDGTKLAYAISGEGTSPVLKATLNDNKRNITEGSKATINSNTYGEERTTVEKVGTETDGSKYMLITLPESMAETGSSAIRRAIMDGGVEVSITYRASKSTTLLPASAVRNEGEGSDYVYLIQRSWGGVLSSSSMKVVKTRVTVAERSDKYVSIEEDLSYQQIADKEDRALTDGQTVMEYVN